MYSTVKKTEKKIKKLVQNSKRLMRHRVSNHGAQNCTRTKKAPLKFTPRENPRTEVHV